MSLESKFVSAIWKYSRRKREKKSFQRSVVRCILAILDFIVLKIIDKLLPSEFVSVFVFLILVVPIFVTRQKSAFHRIYSWIFYRYGVCQQ